MTDWPKPIEGKPHTYNLADVLAALHGRVMGAQLLRQYANDAVIKPTLTDTYYQACLAEADRLEREAA